MSSITSHRTRSPAPPTYSSIPDGLHEVDTIDQLVVDPASNPPQSLNERASTVGAPSRRSIYYHEPQNPYTTASPTLTPVSETNLPFSRAPAARSLHHRESTAASSFAVTSGTNKVKPSNYVALSRSSTSKRRLASLYKNSSSIKGSFAIDPYMHVPGGLLAGLPGPDGGTTGQTNRRDNLKLDVQNGGIDVDLYLIGDPSKAGEGHKERTLLNLQLRDGSEANLDKFPLIARIHTPNLLRPSFQLVATAVNGYLSLHLPDSFHGLLTIHVAAGDLDKHISISPGLQDDSVLLRETNDSRSYFVGETGGWIKGEDAWEGDEIIARVDHGLVRAQYADERDQDGIRKILWKYVGL